jgi:hypothetical protein
MTKFIIAVLFCGMGALAQAPRKAEVARIGIVQPRVDMGNGAGGDSGSGLRTLLTKYLTGPKIEIVSIEAMTPAMVEAEAKEKECDYVLYATLTQQVHKKGGFGVLKGARAMSGVVPVVGMSGRTGAVVAQAAAQTAIGVASEMSANVKAKSEVSFEYRLTAPGEGSPAASNTEKVKAETDGQDVITPMVERMAAAVVGAAVKQ